MKRRKSQTREVREKGVNGADKQTAMQRGEVEGRWQDDG